MRSTLVFLLLTLLCALLPLAAGAGSVSGDDALEVGYLEYPPYYYTGENGAPGGFLLCRSARVFAQAGLRVRFESLPAQRVLDRIRNGERFCSPGWFSTPERRAFARYSLPIYRGRPVEVVTLRSNGSRLGAFKTLRALLSDRSLRIGLIEGFSEGHAVDEMIRELNPPAVRITGSEGQLLRMLAAGRVDYVLLAPEELEFLARAERLDPEAFSGIEMPDAPPGGLRYIICGRNVPEERVQRLNQAIRELFGRIN